MDDQLIERMRRLADRAEIIECLTTYARAMDRFDRELASSVYHEDAIDDHGHFCGPAGEFIEWAMTVPGGEFRHQHYVSNFHVELDGDQAHVETYYLFVATDRDPSAPLKLYGGRYVDRFERRNGRWAIAARKCIPEWKTECDSLTSPQTREADAREGAIARDRSDLSYARPLVRQARNHQ